jgi:hypothetical protein
MTRTGENHRAEWVVRAARGGSTRTRFVPQVLSSQKCLHLPHLFFQSGYTELSITPAVIHRLTFTCRVSVSDAEMLPSWVPREGASIARLSRTSGSISGSVRPVFVTSERVGHDSENHWRNCGNLTPLISTIFCKCMFLSDLELSRSGPSVANSMAPSFNRTYWCPTKYYIRG